MEYDICPKDEAMTETQEKCFGAVLNKLHWIGNFKNPSGDNKVRFDQVSSIHDDDLVGMIGGEKSMVYDLQYPCFNKKGMVSSFDEPSFGSQELAVCDGAKLLEEL